ncbi:MAG TPA: ankyrin repeat domain-containing protein [bacterium]|nr:ankyrin repeat domain-containing protein [bacterium]HQO91560.1 ankyrin repeat domain-containing protein [bacterium]
MAVVLFLIFVGCSSKSGADLIEAVKSNDLEKVKKIADSKNVNATDEMNATPAMWAAYNGNVEILDLLVKNGADVRKKGIIGINTENIPKTYTNALIAAAGEGHLDAVKYLVEKAGVHPDEKGDCLNLFILLPEDIKTTNGLIDFVKESEGKVFDYIRGHEQYKNFINSYEQARPYYFCWILNNLINGKDFVNAVPDTYAFRRVVNNRKKIDSIFDNFLNKRKSYEYVKDQNGGTALNDAAFQGKMAIVTYLIERNSDVNIKDCYGFPPLIGAAMEKRFEAMKILLENRADKKVKVSYGDEKVSVLSQLLMGDCKAPRTDNFKNDLRDILPLLWQTEKDITYSYTDSYPHPLLKACECKDSELVKIMMENGADYSKIEHNGKTLKDICKENGVEIKEEWFKKKEK